MDYVNTSLMMTTPQPEYEPFISKWPLFYMLLILAYTVFLFAVKFNKSIQPEETEEQIFSRFLLEIGRNETVIVWTGSTLVFFVIYGAWKLWG